MAGRSQILSGVLSSSFTTMVVQPFDVVKTAYLTCNRPDSVLRSAQLVYKRFGLPGYWRGSKPAISRSLISGATGFPILELLKSQLPGGFVSNVAASAVTRSIVIFLVSPLTVMKVRMEAPQTTPYKNLTHGLTSIYRLSLIHI